MIPFGKGIPRPWSKELLNWTLLDAFKLFWFWPPAEMKI
jgi:hypothetical protein